MKTLVKIAMCLIVLSLTSCDNKKLDESRVMSFLTQDYSSPEDVEILSMKEIVLMSDAYPIYKIIDKTARFSWDSYNDGVIKINNIRRMVDKVESKKTEYYIVKYKKHGEIGIDTVLLPRCIGYVPYVSNLKTHKSLKEELLKYIDLLEAKVSMSK